MVPKSYFGQSTVYQIMTMFASFYVRMDDKITVVIGDVMNDEASNLCQPECGTASTYLGTNPTFATVEDNRVYRSMLKLH